MSQELDTGPPTATPQATVVPATEREEEEEEEEEEEDEGGPWETAIQETGSHYPEELAP